MSPVSWRDVYQLLDDHRKESREDHEAISRRLAALENAELVRQAQKQTERKYFGLAKSTVAIVVSLIAAVAAVIK